VNATLAAWNKAPEAEAMVAILSCCGSKRWASEMVALRPFGTPEGLSEMADRVWSTMEEPDWLEAFGCHPRIGERREEKAATQSATWSGEEQARTSSASDHILAELEEGNRLYEEAFGFTYIVCATGRSAEEMLEILKRRLNSTREDELREAAEQQRQIMQIRLEKWLID
jgi:2-oxo-4-hydroxy-4-carboxy-5-ureidoimidazoline decarboxylase